MDQNLGKLRVVVIYSSCIIVRSLDAFYILYLKIFRVFGQERFLTMSSWVKLSVALEKLLAPPKLFSNDTRGLETERPGFTACRDQHEWRPICFAVGHLVKGLIMVMMMMT